MSYDQKCFDLAESFLADAGFSGSDIIDGLAYEIQDVIEAYIKEIERSEE
ncbi:MAG TPA: hypothetical protein VK629_12910 [Steroidobacteraceae bacterium]|nr:hypothetical protein [Steroidobacteraceae bacterium]